MAGLLVAQGPAVVLDGMAVMPADTFAPGPPSGAFRTSGWAGRAEFPSQPVQGFSSLWPAATGDADWFALVDNGFGTRANSPDALLRLYQVRLDWGAGRAAPSGAIIELSDPNHHLPFHLVRDDTPDRRLTGGDLDPEAFVRLPNGEVWIGEEFGPFLVHFDARGRVIGPPHALDGLHSPDNPGDLPPEAGLVSTARVRRSRGFEGLASADRGHFLYAALEAGPIDDPSGTTRIIEFDTHTNNWTGRWWRYALDAADQGITEFIGLGDVLGSPCAGRFLTIERDNGQGDTAKFKRVFEVALAPSAAGAAMPLRAEKRLIADLLDIQNDAGVGGFGTRFTFPYITTEALWPVDRQTLVLVNDNNYPASGGRGPQKDATEFIRIHLASPLCAP